VSHSTFNLFDSPDFTASQTDFNTMGMGWGVCQDIFHNSFGEFTGSLILFQNDENPKASLYVIPIHAIHGCYLFR
jgi:hypothetical protein